MVNLRNDYCYIAHPKIINRMINLNNQTFVGYGLDEHCKNAEKLIQKQIGKNSDVFFLTGGTITNKVLISHILKPYEAVIAASSGHINVHETGTIEQSGHKILTMPHKNGKVYPEGIIELVKSHCDEHMVKPKMVYISNSTEYGTIYSLNELTAISKICKKYDLYLYMDGARLGSALMCKENDLSLNDIASLTDAFYIGGTKNGAILGEALIINNKALCDDVRYSIKHFGGMYAKSFVSGIQFECLFENSLFYDIAKYENELSDLLRNELKKLNVKFFNDSPTNQIFVYFNKTQSKLIQEKIMCEIFLSTEDEDCIRFVTHYNLKKEDIVEAINIIKEVL